MTPASTSIPLEEFKNLPNNRIDEEGDTAGAKDDSSSHEPQHGGVEAEDEAEAEARYKPKSLKFWMVLLGMYVSVLIVSLVSE